MKENEHTMMNAEYKHSALKAFLTYQLMKGDRPDEDNLPAAYTAGVVRVLANEADNPRNGDLQDVFQGGFDYYNRNYPDVAFSLNGDQELSAYDEGRDWALHCVRETNSFNQHLFFYNLFGTPKDTATQDEKGGD